MFRPLEISGGGYGGVLSTDYESKQTSVWCDSFAEGHPGPAATTALHSKERIIKSKRSHNQWSTDSWTWLEPNSSFRFSLFKGEHKEKQVVWEILNLLLMQIMANLVLERQSEERTPSRDKTNEEICWKIHFRGQLTAAPRLWNKWTHAIRTVGTSCYLQNTSDTILFFFRNNYANRDQQTENETSSPPSASFICLPALTWRVHSSNRALLQEWIANC